MHLSTPLLASSSNGRVSRPAYEISIPLSKGVFKKNNKIFLVPGIKTSFQSYSALLFITCFPLQIKDCDRCQRGNTRESKCHDYDVLHPVKVVA